ncbi:MAG: protein-glutamate O-methyltransferase CheR [Deltaproteobacteria bacterium]|nr:protein-glutamate O-methyltransferase CheR [Deltaproteobacteria bacterium]
MAPRMPLELPQAIPLGPQPMGDREFGQLRDLVYAHAGIHLGPAKRALLTARLQRRMRELGLHDWKSYVARVLDDATGLERRKLIEAICTHETSFFRERPQFDYLENELFPAWQRAAAEGRRHKRVRVWSAACSTGEEPFSVAMSLLAHLPVSQGWQHEIVATDLSRRVLEKAEAGEWPIDRNVGIPESYLKAFMLRGVGENVRKMRASDPLRAIIRFQQLNLNEPIPSTMGQFDLVLCRNVLIYFDAKSKARALDGLLSRLSPSGILLVGHAETLTGMTDRMRSLKPTIYAQLPSAVSRP